MDKISEDLYSAMIEARDNLRLSPHSTTTIGFSIAMSLVSIADSLKRIADVAERDESRPRY